MVSYYLAYLPVIKISLKKKSTKVKYFIQYQYEYIENQSKLPEAVDVKRFEINYFRNQ